MLGIDLTALNSPELRRLLERARARGQDGLVRNIEAELSARVGRRPRQPTPMSATSLSAAHNPPPPVRRRGPAIAVAGLAAFTGAAVAWGLSLNMQPPPRAQPAALTTAQPASRIAVALTTTALPEPVSDQSFAEPAVALTPPIRMALARPSEPGRNPCYDLPTNQERLLCGYPSLAIKDRQMKMALERARANGSDVKAIEDAQAAWQEGSANVSDRLVLAQRYARRIAELETD
jgi:hypothetical protein